MLTKDIRKTIDNARDVLVGKIPNPQSQIEQITIAMIYKFMDDMDIESVEFGGERQFFVEELSEYAWSKIMSQQLGNEARMNLYTEALDKLQLSDRIPKLFRDIFKGAYLPFRDGQTLTLFLKEINDLSYNNSENLGNGFEYLLSIMGSQGDAGQFRTPRHIIDFIVDIVRPTKADTILDPACGTAGFLISAYKYIQKTAEDLKQPLTPQERTALTENIQGYDISPDMVKLALVNMYLHKFKDPKIYEYDTLTQDTRWDNYFDCILANPPFMTPKGGIQPHNKFGVKANRSEVLFVDYIMEHLNSTGRAGVIVPEGIVFQSANAYKELRKKLVDENYLYAVVSLPSGIFQPYSGVKTSILFMDRQLAKKTDKVLFVEIQNDGFDLGAQRRPIDKNDLPKALELINQWQNAINTKTDFSSDSPMITLVEKSKLAGNEEYNLTASRYKVQKDYTNCKWKMVKLGDICEIVSGQSPEGIYYNENGDGCPFYQGKTEFTNKYIGKPKKWTTKITKEAVCGDILMSVRAPVGPVNIATEKCCIGRGLALIRAKEQVIQSYLFHILRNKENEIIGNKGAAFDSITKKDIESIQIPLPPLELQEEIVKELDGYQAVIDGAQKVVDNWKPTLPINPNWEKVKLGDVCDVRDGTHDSPKYYEIGYPLVTSKNLINGKIDFTNINYISKEDYDKICQRSNVDNGDVLYAMIGTIGNPVVVEKNRDFAIKNVALFKVGECNQKLNNKYLKYLLDNLTTDFNNQAIGGTQKFVSLKFIRNYHIPLPSLETQEEMVSKIEKEEYAIEECRKLIELHKEKINTKIQSIWGDSCENNN